MPIPPHIVHLRKKVGTDLLQVPGISALLFNPKGQILLQRRSDNGQWHTLGGCVDPGENPADCCIREVREETGLEITLRRITGVYALPTVTYPNGDQVSFVSIGFLCELKDPAAQPRITDDESLELKWFDPADLPPLRSDALQRIRDALKGQPEAIFEQTL